jgi:hypothetical protein
MDLLLDQMEAALHDPEHWVPDDRVVAALLVTD